MRGPVKVFDSIYLVGSSELSHPLDCCVYLIDAGELVLVDCGAGKSTSRLIDNIHVLGLQPDDLSAVVVTHAHIDHIGSLADIRQRFGVKVIAHSDDAEPIQTGLGTGADAYGIAYVPRPVDEVMSGERLSLRFGKLSLELMHIPGHTPGSIAATTIAGGTKILFGQDIHGPYHPRWRGEPEKALTSLQKLLDERADILLEGHYGAIRPAAEVDAFIRGYMNELSRRR